MNVSRRFTSADQLLFARLSGDFNPLHVDEVAARRSLMGRPVVHGIHAVLWALDAAVQLLHIRALSVDFLRPVFLDEEVVIQARERRGQRVLTIESNGLVLVRVALTPGDAPSVVDGALATGLPRRECPRVLDLDAINGLAGTLPLHLPAEAASLFPHAQALLGPGRLAGLLALTRLVGMECPGLSSLFSGLKVEFAAGGSDVLAWQVTTVDRRFRLVCLDVVSPGLIGRVEAFHRPPPQLQPSMAEIAALVGPSEFVGQKALVVGGSRGIGEVAAKILAAGGGEVTVTYASGAEDAARVAAEITAGGASCRVERFDVLEAGTLPEGLGGWATQLYYFATPKIFDRRPTGFDSGAFHRFARVYVDGFATLVQALAAGGRELACLYPSSTALDDRLPQLAEYTSAKAAGEALCGVLESAHPNLAILVERLPRLATDQTLTLDGFPAEAPLAVLLPVLRRLHALRMPPNSV